MREGAEQLEGLESDVAIRVIHDIRRQLAEGINWSMERTVIRPSLKIPGGRFVLDGFQVRGPRVALWKLRSRLLRLGVKGILWLAAISGIAHWILWVIFEQTYLLQHFPGVGKAVQFILISCTTLFAWGFTKSRQARRRAGKSRLISPMLAIGCWGLLTGAWVHWILWVFFEFPIFRLRWNPLPRWGKLCSSWAGSQPHMRCFGTRTIARTMGTGQVDPMSSKRAGRVSRWPAPGEESGE